ncbi:MAG: biotin--[acetyl-CoA-carboxylase] ligase [Oscillospiraceae bacterium]
MIKITTKEKLLTFLSLKQGEYFSGEDIANELCISRTAVWKAVKSLQGEGYIINAVTNKGYCLSPENDVLSASAIKNLLNAESQGAEIIVLPTVTSTNAYVREKAVMGAAEGYTAVANEQTLGRGRFKRSFYSPKNTGLYMSSLLRPQNYSPLQAVNITTMAAVAMCEAIDTVFHVKAQIKWVNDIFIDNKKVCGILTEAAFGMESGMLEYVVLGVGANVYLPNEGFTKDLCDIAGNILSTKQSDGRNRLAAEFLNRLIFYYSNMDTSLYIEKYRSLSLVMGKQVSVLSKNTSKSAIVTDIDDACRLCVKYEDGTEESLSSGEISIKL